MKFKHKILIGLSVLFMVQSCDINTVNNPNAPTAESLLNDATLADLRLLAHGLESAMRIDMQFHYWTTSIVGREYYDLNGTDPRYTGELLGAQGAFLDNNGFLTTRAWNAAYRTARNANNLITATQNTAASLTTAESNGIIGYAKTILAYALSLELQRQYTNGIRLDVADPDNRGPIVGYEAALNGIISILDEAQDELAAAGDEFVFDLSSGFTGFKTPAKWVEFNRALAARTYLYLGQSGDAANALGESFMDMDMPMSLGVYHAFGTAGNDIRNPMFNVPNQDLYTVQQDWLDNAEEGDTRVDEKTTPLDPDAVTVPVVLDGLTGSVQVTMFSSDTDPFPMIRNEELLLILAEVNASSNPDDAVEALNTVRTAAGLDPYDGETSESALMAEIRQQRRYALFGEGHRWIDMRRWDRLDEIRQIAENDRDGDVVHEKFPTPVLELN